MQVVSESKLSIPLREINVDTPNRYKILKNGINRTKPEEILGRGSFGTVVKAIYKGKQVAVKILKTSNQSQMQTIKNESNILGWQHKNIIEILKVDSTSTYSTIIMSRFPGQCLQLVLDKIKISLYHRICIILDIVNGLNYCHQNGILHLDIKPQNILVAYVQSISPNKKNANYVCKICDFGSSIKMNEYKNNENIQTQGTIRYMSPEMLKNENLSTKSDIYSLGITMWQLKSNIFPYSSINCNETVAYKVVKENLRPDSTDITLVIGNKQKECVCEHYTTEFLNNSVEHLLNCKDLQFISPFRRRKQIFDMNTQRNLRKSLFVAPSTMLTDKILSQFSNNSLENLLLNGDFKLFSPFEKTSQKNLQKFSFISKSNSQNALENIENLLNSEDLEIISQRNEKTFDKYLRKSSFTIQKSLFEIPICSITGSHHENIIEFNLQSIFMNKGEKIADNFENQYENIYKICWHSDPMKRPTGQNLIKQLNNILKLF